MDGLRRGSCVGVRRRWVLGAGLGGFVLIWAGVVSVGVRACGLLGSAGARAAGWSGLGVWVACVRPLVRPCVRPPVRLSARPLAPRASVRPHARSSAHPPARPAVGA